MLKSLPLSEVYRLLEPGPVVLVATADKNKDNVMAMSWYTMMEFEPPLIGCVISGNDHTFDILKKTKECVIAVPTLGIAKKVVKAGNTSGRDIDKFKEIGFTAAKASRVKAPLVEECYANIECKMSDASLVGKYNFFILKAVKAWIDPKAKNPQTLHHLGKGIFMTSGKTVKIASKMK
ncbi:MAG TPA: flavin reductase family protein [Candidatus Colwellbacteria bacterium]|jgi:flavin reductase (DIM6/NTAB) family NADH-FMN oxidoreductase RutF|nr:flavin reductase family protein [Candidatus Colwellbacteria bacterium]